MPLTYDQIRSALEGERMPCIVVDLDAFDRNLARHLAILAPRGTPLRLATKSVRVPALIQRVQSRAGSDGRGLMCFDVDEVAALAAEGHDDMLVAYPTLQKRHLDTLARLTAEGKNVSLAIDSEEAGRAMDASGKAHGTKLRAVLCVDMALEKLGGRVHLGVRRSPLHTPEQVLALARSIRDKGGVTVHGLLGYEAQVAGMGDDSPFEARTNRIKAWIRSASVADVNERRPAMVAALRADGFDLALVNGGGTGSLDSTTPESGVTEVTAGSGLFKPHLFDYYSSDHMRAHEPACFFVLVVVRRPSPKYVTCGGGGYVASGSAGPDKSPRPWLPEGLALLPMEMAGEVQTPLEVPSGLEIPLGAPVVFRAAKAGEPMERFKEVVLLQNGRVVDRVPTYRGKGWSFL